ncbi:pre-mRNA-splicing factor [Rhynchospora pubera]|uniref:Pre-mRNA-splicing factor n=1 Tax=Rhynchospora pubera TaxID=906938 RepID=A0AAV8C312_9POAL|nr:pre-mRNA-splicing factor [Rhynchospora pubera]
MDSPRSDGSPDKVEMEPSFRKLSGDAANRTYRRPTHVSQSDSSSSDENNEHERSHNAISRKDSAKVISNDHVRKDEEKEMDRRRSYSRSDRGQDRYSDRYSYRESRRHEDKDHRKRDVRHYDESGRDYARSSRSERSDNSYHKDRNKDREKEHERSNSRRKDVDSGRDHYYRERDNKDYYDDKRGPRRSPERFDKNEKVKEKNRHRETDEGEIEGGERRKHYQRENETRKRSEPASSFGREEKQRETKFSKPAETNVEEKSSSSSKQLTEASKDRVNPALPSSLVGSETGVATDLNAAKAAAMKAAEFVNKNIGGGGGGGGGVGGPLTTEQKKKLLWGNKKNESAGTETVKKWDNLFTDRERQEKFNKLMNLRMPWYIWPDVGCEGKCGSRKQFRGKGRKSRRKEQRGVGYGLGEAIHCRSPPQRWQNCWSGSVEYFFMNLSKTCLVSCFMCCTMVGNSLLVGSNYLLLNILYSCSICIMNFCWIGFKLLVGHHLIVVPNKTLGVNINGNGFIAKLDSQRSEE